MTTAHAAAAPPRADLHARVTSKIIAALEAGETTFTFPWRRTTGGPPRNVVSGKPYRGINSVLLWIESQAAGYASPHWATYRQWTTRGGQVRRGEAGTMIVFWKSLDRPDTGGAAGSSDDTGEDGDTAGRRRLIAKAYTVFNADQVDGLPAATGQPELTDDQRLAAAERFFAALPLTVEHGGEQAFYQPSRDLIRLPPFSAFIHAPAYYATRGHESIHATGAPHRLHRDLAGRYGTEAYAMEELIAELGAAFLCAELGIDPEPRPDHAGYIASWLKVLRGDTRAIFTAASHAQRAIDWLQEQQGAPALDLAARPGETVAG